MSLTLEGLYKEARSLDAQRKKQYWQMMKRLHGGNDEAVEAIRKSGDDGIWHGTREELIDSIDENGLQVGPFREFGKGTFFGDKQTANYYARNSLKTKSDALPNEVELPNGERIDIAHFQKRRDYEDSLTDNPNSALYNFSRGKFVRLAKPSELRDTKIKYPNPSVVKVFDVNTLDGLNSVARSQTAYMAEKDDGIQRLMKMRNAGLNSDNPEVRESTLRKILNEHNDFYQDTEWKVINNIDEEVKELLELQQSNPNKFARTLRNYQNGAAESLSEKLYTVRNEDELNQLKYYGKLRGRRVFDRLGVNHRAEMFVDKQNVPPELLRYEDGSKLNGTTKTMDTSIQNNQGMNPYLIGGAALGGIGLTGAGIYGYKKYKDNQEKEASLTMSGMYK